MNRPIRVLYHFQGHKIDTGSPRALVNHIEALDRSVVEPWFLATGEVPLSEGLRVRNVNVVIGPASWVTYVRPFASVRQVANQMALLRKLQIDIVHINEFGWNSDLAVAARLCGIPVVLHVHLKTSVDFQNLNRFMASAVILVSEEQRRTIVHFDRIASRSHVIYNPVPLERLASGKSIRPSLGLADDQYVIGTVAQLREGKGIDILLETARILLPRYPKLVFIVIGRAGEGQEAYANEMLEAAKQPPLAGRVHFLGSRTDIPDLLASMDAFFLPTRIETLSVAVVEAMAASLPVTTTRVGGMSELLPTPEVGAIVEPLAAEGFAAVLARWIDHPDEAKAIGQRAKASVWSRFDPSSVQRQLAALYQSLLDKRS